MKTTVIILAATVLLAGCGGGRAKKADGPQKNAEEMIVDAHNSLTSLDYVGSYSGDMLLPSGKAGDVTLTLGWDDYTLVRTGGEETGGEYSWDDSGSVITLHGENPPVHYKVGENVLIPVGKDGAPVKNAGKYSLHKTTEGCE